MCQSLSTRQISKYLISPPDFDVSLPKAGTFLQAFITAYKSRPNYLYGVLWVTSWGAVLRKLSRCFSFSSTTAFGV